MNDARRQKVKELILKLQGIEEELRELIAEEEKALNNLTEHFVKTDHTFDMEGKLDTLRKSLDNTVNLIGYLNYVLK